MVGKMGGEAMSHLNSSSGSVEPSLYYPGQKRPGEDGGEEEERMGAQGQEGGKQFIHEIPFNVSINRETKPVISHLEIV